MVGKGKTGNELKIISALQRETRKNYLCDAGTFLCASKLQVGTLR